jgi:hypothetical protein
MSAASVRAIASHRNAATQEGLERAVAWSRQWSAEFPFCLANHLPMVLVALHRMGASDDRLKAYCHIYREQNGLVPVPEAIGAITRDNWREFLGQREREADYRTFFTGEVARLGAAPAALLYLPQLMPGMAASATHAFMRMAYATIRRRFSLSCPARNRSGMSSPSAISYGTSCARSPRSPNSRLSAICSRLCQRPMTESPAARWRSTLGRSTFARCMRSPERTG